ncbi:hypothetical protein [Burkholderia sp. AU32262]|uniref:hypothetical protein n=1 Tax=Burkholderia sp. AU32262 TaxID=2879630 RepID=UPI001CF20F98|nr:hypothetical protein [Burkholderia sp. AU32262]MCA8239450.1 hypothetical protein [Burkholderia sp. AU32262]
MKKITEIIVAPPILPARFVSNEYDRFLFFDFSLRTEFSIFDEIKDIAGGLGGINVFYARSLSFLCFCGDNENWSERIACVDQELNRQSEPYGLVVTDFNANWVLAQHSPVEWGLFAFKSISPLSLLIFNSLSGDDFLSVNDFRSAIVDGGARLHGNFDRKFIECLISNY